jgi:catechol 2,3-dioxygenase-like lactoylglutathione lyase family enzyme
MARIVANIPVLPSRDLERSAAFYARLGYRTVQAYPDYLILSCDGGELHLARMDVEPGQNPAGLYLRVAGVDGIAAALNAIAEDKPWGQRELALADPDGNLLRIGEPVSGSGPADRQP